MYDVIDQEYAEGRYKTSQYAHYETFEFRQAYIPSHLNYEQWSEPEAMQYLIDRGYLQAPYFDWETKTVTA